MVTVINTSSDIIRVEISDADFDSNIHANGMHRISLTLFRTYNIKMTKVRSVQRTTYTPVEEGGTLDVAHYFD
ncbi:hypothetical protein HYPSUDRAFT_415647 [Hypholoma sublateritium FD-334 SS-4]|uniref:Uncharacterized protein n=1 Tax=Hypholoma sublateritium (strain FD-334 SS-4) TaxID=945553 RepID=A0A0D2LVF8_HYPSF|nr:hypothetical protein HYPSUDRAFT_415647 [Hypholoma sublateritium FD-334 SS-4]